MILRKSKKKISSHNKNLKSTIKNENNIKFLLKTNKYVTQEQTIKLLDQFIKSNLISNDEYNKLIKKIKPLSVQGNSGSIIGFDPAKPNIILKFYKYDLDIDKLIKSGECVKIHNMLNELIINIVVAKLLHFVKISYPEQNSLKRNTNYLLDYGISNIGTYAIYPKIGLSNTETNNITNSKLQPYYITNLRELLEYNHHPILHSILQNTNTNNSQLLKLYDKLMSEKIKNYLDVLKLLQRKINYLNSDVKMTNIFIKYTGDDKVGVGSGSISKWDKLQRIGIIVDFELLLADLEKSSYSLNKNRDTSIIPYPSSKFKTKIKSFFGMQLTNYVKYSCNKSTDNTICKNIIDIWQFDVITFIIDYYAYLIRLDENIIKTLNNTYNLLTEYLDRDKLDKLIIFLKKGKYIIDKNYFYYINNILTTFCKSYKVDRRNNIPA